jgi:ribonuclease VapC
LDSSALIALFLQEPGWEALQHRVDEAETIAISAATLLETQMVLTNRTGRDALPLLEAFILETGVEVIPFTQFHWRMAAQAFLRYGKGRHRAALNFGDCIAYATAKEAQMPLLYKGEDFERTDAAVQHK